MDIDLEVLAAQGYVRRQCRVTDLWFWSCDPARETCGDTAEDEYEFIGAPLFDGFGALTGPPLKDALRERFLSFFERHDHTRVAPQPVLARWRDDIHLTIASIAAFQPHVTSGQSRPPANPLAISQPCIRLVDVGAVGRSGRHLTTFEMMAGHAFNKPLEGELHYWIPRCVELCQVFLVEDLGIDPMRVTYVENPWAGGGNAGPAVEVIVGGLELATLVFMNLEEHDGGPYEIKGQRYREMALQVIDTGYGLERFCWAAAGTPTIYEAIYPSSVAWLKQLAGYERVLAAHDQLDVDHILSELSRVAGILNSEFDSDTVALRAAQLERLQARGVAVTAEELGAITEPLERIHAIPDHLQAICLMLGDGLVPSNAKAGYLLRMLARRVLRLRDELGLEVGLDALAEHHLDEHLADATMKQHRAGLLAILRLEEERWNETLRRGTGLVETALASIPRDATQLDDDMLVHLNDTYGLAPDVVIGIAHEAGWSQVRVRKGFHAELGDRHAAQARQAARPKAVARVLGGRDGLPPTVRQYEDDVHQRSFDASVLACVPLGSTMLEDLGLDPEEGHEPTHAIVLNRTSFYPEGGGQAADHGILQTEGGDRRRVLDARIEGEQILHFVDGPVDIGELVHGELDWPRRKQLMDHHTSVHIVGGSARRILGPHVFQAGASKTVEGARLDITHYERLERADLDRIEAMANQVVRQVTRTEKLELDRHDADRRFGFDLYQGGAPKGDRIRILRIAEHDVQACGGTHHDDPGQIGLIRIVRSTQVQDGVERLHIVAGDAALDYARGMERLVRDASDVVSVQPEDLPRTVERFFGEWKQQRKRIDELETRLAKLETVQAMQGAPTVDGVRMVIEEVDGDQPQLQQLARQLTSDASAPTVVVLGSRAGGGKLLVAITDDSPASARHDANHILRSISSHVGGGGGGRPAFAQGGGPNADGVPDALAAARALLGVA